jgi:hypothetical protein
MMLILVLAYSLSEVTEKEAAHYTTVQLAAPGPWLDLATQAGNLVILGERDLVEWISRRTAAQDVDILVKGSSRRRVSDTLRHLGLQRPFVDDIDAVYSRWLQSEGDIDDDDINGTLLEGEDGDIFVLLDAARRQISELLENPMTVPTFAQYVSASLALSSLIDTEDMPDILADSSFGRQWGNLLTLGTLHLSPTSNPVVYEFWSYLNDTYPSFMIQNDENDQQQPNLLVRVHESELDALQFINDNLMERTWALLDFENYRQNAVVEQAEYKIRMNYTTLPNTAELVNWASIGLNWRYKRYYLSGYMTLQRTVNEFAISRSENCDEVDTNLWSKLVTK